jgi:hypothetical protein
MSMHVTKLSLLLLCAAGVLQSGGCASGATCDEGAELVRDICVPVSVPPPTVDAGSDASASDDAGNDDAAAETFLGKTCTDDVDHSECGGEADYCAKMPGQAEGICTITGCMLPMTGCPTGWRCLDLSVFDPTYPPICVEE